MIFVLQRAACGVFLAILCRSCSAFQQLRSDRFALARKPATKLASSIAIKDTKTSASLGVPGAAQLPWAELGFEYRPTKSHVRMVFKDGKWGTPELVQDPYVKLHIGATALHYGQSCFEGLKAFCHADNSVHLFCVEENAKRMQTSCQRLVMAELPADLFIQAVTMAVRDNVEYVPPYGSNGSLYIRPLLFGSSPRVGLQPADEYTFICMVTPVGDYYKGGLKPVNALIITDYDRAAPRGVGNVKVAGNYAADLLPNTLTKKKGYPIGLYLDAATQTMIDEFSTSNFAGIRDNTYITPNSLSALPSITNKALMQIANDMGMNVEHRSVHVSELESMDEVLAIGTAVVVTPVGSITTNDGKVYDYEQSNSIGPITTQLYDRVRAIQNGESDDIHSWLLKVQ